MVNELAEQMSVVAPEVILNSSVSHARINSNPFSKRRISVGFLVAFHTPKDRQRLILAHELAHLSHIKVQFPFRLLSAFFPSLIMISIVLTLWTWIDPRELAAVMLVGLLNLAALVLIARRDECQTDLQAVRLTGELNAFYQMAERESQGVKTRDLVFVQFQMYDSGH